MKTMHLFAGAGGGLLADLILGHEPVAAVEWDSYCCQVLRERAAEGWFPGLQVYEGDVRMFNASDWKGRVDCIHAGFPCQDISNAGKRAGVDEGTRSGLYLEVLRCADEIRPKFLFLENVSAILSNGLGTVLGDLAARGYGARWCCIRASDVGAPHQRDRWWCLAYPNVGGGSSEPGKQQDKRTEIVDPGCQGNVAYSVHSMERWVTREGENEGDAIPNTTDNRIGWGVEFTGSGEKAWHVADSKSQRFGEAGRDRKRSEARIASGGEALANPPPGDNESRGGGTRSGREGPANDGGRESPFPVGVVVDGMAADLGGSSWWEVEPEIGRTVKKEDSRGAKLKALGNGQVPLQAALAFKILMGG